MKRFDRRIPDTIFSDSFGSGKTNEMARHFDRKAADWDANERRRAMAADIVRAVEREWPTDFAPKLLDYGAGTGLCSLALAPRCKSVLAMDVSAEMLAQLVRKATAAGMNHLQTLQHDLCCSPLDGCRFDVILCAMTLHHIEDVDFILGRFQSMLEPGGFLVIADLETEDGTFHDEPTGVYHTGFNRDCLSRKMMIAGFTFVTVDTIHRISKTRDAVTKDYPIFCAVGRTRVASSNSEQIHSTRPI